MKRPPRIQEIIQTIQDLDPKRIGIIAELIEYTSFIEDKLWLERNKDKVFIPTQLQNELGKKMDYDTFRIEYLGDFQLQAKELKVDKTEREAFKSSVFKSSIPWVEESSIIPDEAYNSIVTKLTKDMKVLLPVSESIEKQEPIKLEDVPMSKFNDVLQDLRFNQEKVEYKGEVLRITDTNTRLDYHRGPCVTVTFSNGKIEEFIL